MMGEFQNVLKQFPNFAKDHLKFPRAFTYELNKLMGVEGPTYESQRAVGSHRDRMKAVLGLRGEEIVDDALHKAFSKRTSLMWNSLETDKLFKIAKDCVKYKLEQTKKQDVSLLNIPLLPEERNLHQLLGVDVAKIEREVDKFVKELFHDRLEMTE